MTSLLLSTIGAIGMTVAQHAVVPDDRLRPPPAIPSDVGEVARNLVSQGKALQMPVKGKVKHSINKGAPTFGMPGGASSVVLVRLPDYQAPWFLTIKSWRRGIGRTTEIFVPSGLYFDDDFQQVGAFGEEHVTGIEEGLVASLAFSDQHSTLRYLLLYTRGDLVGQSIDMRASFYGAAIPGKLGTILGSGFGIGRLNRSLEAKLEVSRTEGAKLK